MVNRFFAAALIALGAALGCTQSTDHPTAVEANSSDSTNEGEPWIIRGQVLTLDDQPATDVEVATYWSANGQQWDENGVFPKVETEADAAEFWNDEGIMEPYPELRGTLSGNGQFSIEKSKRHPYVVLALNERRTHGGIGTASPDCEQPISIQLESLVRVFGEIRCAGRIPGWTHVYVYYTGHLKEVPD